MVLNCGILLKHRDGNKERGGGGECMKSFKCNSGKKTSFGLKDSWLLEITSSQSEGDTPEKLTFDNFFLELA